MALPRGLVQSLGAGPAENLHIENSQEPRNKMKILWKENMKWALATEYLLLARALNVSSKVIALMLSVAKMASLSAIDVSSVELGTWYYQLFK